jgi:PilZ domain
MSEHELLDCIQRDKCECYSRTMNKEQRGLRFLFNACAEVIVESSTEKISARVIELSLRGCFLEISSLPSETHRLRIKIWHSDQFFEASAEVLYVRATGVGVVFSDMKPHSRTVLQAWILAALDHQVQLESI